MGSDNREDDDIEFRNALSIVVKRLKEYIYVILVLVIFVLLLVWLIIGFGVNIIALITTPIALIKHFFQ